MKEDEGMSDYSGTTNCRCFSDEVSDPVDLGEIIRLGVLAVLRQRGVDIDAMDREARYRLNQPYRIIVRTLLRAIAGTGGDDPRHAALSCVRHGPAWGVDTSSPLPAWIPNSPDQLPPDGFEKGWGYDDFGESPAPITLAALFGERLRVTRERRGLSQTELAEQMSARSGEEISRDVVASIENGRRKTVTLEQAVAAALALDVAPSDLLTPDRPGQQVRLGDGSVVHSKDLAEWIMGFAARDQDHGAHTMIST